MRQVHRCVFAVRMPADGDLPDRPGAVPDLPLIIERVPFLHHLSCRFGIDQVIGERAKTTYPLGPACRDRDGHGNVRNVPDTRGVDAKILPVVGYELTTVGFPDDLDGLDDQVLPLIDRRPPLTCRVPGEILTRAGAESEAAVNQDL